ncbi:MAG: hypothetical protein NZ578_05425 [Candidatus Binatia bacterium]|nr:hypothetical protein [Candidatus Binatia bacterium]
MRSPRLLNVSVRRLGDLSTHDARIVAATSVPGVTHILTLNTADFVRYRPRGIVVVDPTTV